MKLILGIGAFGPLFVALAYCVLQMIGALLGTDHYDDTDVDVDAATVRRGRALFVLVCAAALAIADPIAAVLLAHPPLELVVRAALGGALAGALAGRGALLGSGVMLGLAAVLWPLALVVGYALHVGALWFAFTIGA